MIPTTSPLLRFMRKIALQAAINADTAAVQGRRRRNRRNYVEEAFAVNDQEFLKTYGLSKSLVKKLIRELRPYLPKELRSHAVGGDEKVLLALASYVSGAEQSLLHPSSYAQPTVSTVVGEVTHALNEVKERFIQFPHTQDERERIKREFYSKYGIPGVIGCVDGTNVRILKPSIPLFNGEPFDMTDGYYYLNVMIVSDANLNILCVDPSHPGNINNSTIWTNHHLNHYTEELNKDGTNFLLGDNSYALRSNMVTPISNAAKDSPESYYNNVHNKAHGAVKRTIGALKARFRCLSGARRLNFKPEKAAQIITACCVLHNIANRANLPPSKQINTDLDAESNLKERKDHVEMESSRNEPLEQGRNLQRSLVQTIWQNSDQCLNEMFFA